MSDFGEIAGVVIRPLKIHADDRGWIFEALRRDDPAFSTFAQSTVTLTYSGIIKAFHYHQKQDDFWVVVRGMAQTVLYDRREGSQTHGKTQVIFMGEAKPLMVKIPAGVVHGYKVISPEPVILVYYTSELYDPADEFRIPYDDPEIGFDWRTTFR